MIAQLCYILNLKLTHLSDALLLCLFESCVTSVKVCDSAACSTTCSKLSATVNVSRGVTCCSGQQQAEDVSVSDSSSVDGKQTQT